MRLLILAALTLTGCASQPKYTLLYCNEKDGGCTEQPSLPKDTCDSMISQLNASSKSCFPDAKKDE